MFCAVIHGVAESRTWLSDWTELKYVLDPMRGILYKLKFQQNSRALISCFGDCLSLPGSVWSQFSWVMKAHKGSWFIATPTGMKVMRNRRDVYPCLHSLLSFPSFFVWLYCILFIITLVLKCFLSYFIRPLNHSGRRQVLFKPFYRQKKKIKI